MAAPEIYRIHIGEDELSAGALTDGKLTEASAALERDGIVLLHNAIDPAKVETLRAKVEADFQEISARRSLNAKYPAPPRTAQWLIKDILYNPFAIQVLHELLGPGFYWDNYAQNAVPPHSDGKQCELTRRVSAPQHACRLIYLID